MKRMNPITLSRLGRSLHKATMDRMKQTINSNKPMINRAAVACAQPLTNKRKDKMLTQSLGHDWKCYLTHWSTPASCVYLRMPCMWTNSCNVIKFKRPEYIHIVSPTNGRISALSLSLSHHFYELFTVSNLMCFWCHLLLSTELQLPQSEFCVCSVYLTYGKTINLLPDVGLHFFPCKGSADRAK